MQESSLIPHENKTEHAAELARFQKEIAELKAREQGTAHLRDIQPEELTAEDAYIYELFLQNTLDPNIFEIYRNAIQEEGSRADFAAYVANKIIDLLIKYYSTPMFIFRLRRCKNYSSYTPYMPHNFCFVSHEI